MLLTHPGTFPGSPHPPPMFLPIFRWCRAKGPDEEGDLQLPGLCSLLGLSVLFPTIIAITVVTCIIWMHSVDKITSTLCMARYMYILNTGMNMCYYLLNSRRVQELRCWVAEWEIESHSSAWTRDLFFLKSYPLNPFLVLKDILISWDQNNFLSLQGLIINSSLMFLDLFLSSESKLSADNNRIISSADLKHFKWGLSICVSDLKIIVCILLLYQLLQKLVIHKIFTRNC